MARYMQPKYHRDRAPSTIYEDNYGYTINFYQPMIDYLDDKQRGISSKYPHLPWENERALKKYWPSNTVRGYSNQEITKYSKEVYDHARIRERELEDYKVIKRVSPLSVTKSASGARITKHIHLPSIEEKIIRKQEDRARERKIAKIMADCERIKNRINFEHNSDQTISQELKRSIRGKTAGQITAALLSESNKNIKTAKNEEEMAISKMTSQMRGSSDARIVRRTTNIELIDDKCIDHLDTSMSSSLHDVKKQLAGFNQRADELFHNSRCRRKYY